MPGGGNGSRHGGVRIVTMAKDEGPYVLEWVAHHHVLGFTDILAYTNDCTDGTDEMFDALAACGLCTRLDNPKWREKPPQSRALNWAEKNPLVTGADWLLVMDLDEFVTVKVGDYRIDSLIGSSQLMMQGCIALKLKLHPPHIFLRPRVARFGILDFHKVEEILDESAEIKDELKRSMDALIRAMAQQ